MASGAGGSVAGQPGGGEGTKPKSFNWISFPQGTSNLEGLSFLIRKKPLLDDEPPLAGYSTTSRDSGGKL